MSTQPATRVYSGPTNKSLPVTRERIPLLNRNGSHEYRSEGREGAIWLLSVQTANANERAQGHYKW
jgi:hypothetical protein